MLEGVELKLEEYEKGIKETESRIAKSRKRISVAAFLGLFILIFGISIFISDTVKAKQQYFERGSYEFIIIFLGLIVGLYSAVWGAEKSIRIFEKLSKNYLYLSAKLIKLKGNKKILDQEMDIINEKGMQKRRQEYMEKLNILTDIHPKVFRKKLSHKNIDLYKKFISYGNPLDLFLGSFVFGRDTEEDLEIRKKLSYFSNYSSYLQSKIEKFLKEDLEISVDSSKKSVRLVESDNIASVKGVLFQDKDIDRASARKIKINFLEKNKQNIELGMRGEIIVLKWEKDNLIEQGLNNLAKKVRHISQEIGDGAGYDILSYDEEGKEKFIEVKTTKRGVVSQFYYSGNELNFMRNCDNYYLYRLNLENEKEAELTIISKDDFLNKFEIFPYQYVVRLKK